MSFNKIDSLPKEVAERIFERRRRGASWADIRAEFGIGDKTAKALLEKHDFDHSPLGEAPPRVEMWSRPCLRCGKEERRAKGLFRCKQCRREGRDDYNAADGMYAGYTMGG